MNYGFIIDNRKCIGCHACSTACKSENEVPLGVARTWVKYVETGAYPDSRRHFQVTRCNHCANPPCVRICPVTAMYQRHDGIVEFDKDICIGCKACMQACPYDAIYIDPESHTAAKCHYCSHRTDIGLEPACVVVCPEHAIIAGDMDNPNTEISHLLATQPVTVRKPEQGTAPKLFYINGNDLVMHPTATERTPENFMWAEVIPLHAKPANGELQMASEAASRISQPATLSNSGTAIRNPGVQGVPSYGPIQIGQGRMAEQMVQTSYNFQHKVPWHWPVPAYLVTKGIGSGAFMLLALGSILGLFPVGGLSAVVIGFLSLLFIGITTGLLVLDLDRPERFFSILTRPQWGSWLTRGAFLLIGFTGVAGLWWLLELVSLAGFLTGVTAALRPLFMWLGLVLAAGSAVYTAFLFGQAEGRDLWQSSLLPFHLIVQALMMGGALIVLLDVFMEIGPELANVARLTFIGMLILDLLVTLFGEFGMPHASEVAARAAHEISHGRYKSHFWSGSIALGHVLPLILLWPGWPMATAIAAVAAMIGLYLFEYAFVMAPQEIPNS